MGTTPKEQYEARKAARDKLRDMDVLIEQRTSQVMVLDMLDRFVMAAERIADAMEKKPYHGIAERAGLENT
jgi:hypothetical protein